MDAQHHVTLTCPGGHTEGAVGDPSTMRWYCFRCHDEGRPTYTGRFSYDLRYDESATDTELATAHDDPPAR